MRYRRGVAAALLAALAAAGCSGSGDDAREATERNEARTVAGGELAPRALVERLRAGGYVLYFRHAATDWSQQDADPVRFDDCSTQRNLSAPGRQDARAIGRAFRALELPVGAVRASRFCRTLETARLAFGRAEPTTDLTSLRTASEAEEEERRVQALRRLLATPPREGANTILVAHLFNIQAAADVSLAEGEAAVFVPRGEGRFVLLGRLGVADLGALARGRPSGQVSVREFRVPEGSHPHDVAPAADGTVWYTAQATGALGRFDPATGEAREIALGEGSAPHGVIVGHDGAAWVTDGGLNAIVRVDGRTEQVRRFPLPGETGYANLNTAAFDGAGTLWFTGQSGVYGRLDPRRGRVEVFDAPRGAGPYGIAVTPSGDVYYASLAGSHIARIDARSGRATVIEPPTPDQGARRIWSDSTGRLWVTEWNAGKLAVFDPARNAWREWRLPGDSPQPYAVYVDERDIVWVSDFGANALVRFDPRREQFRVLELPSEGAAVRQLLGRPGEVWGAESGTDKLVVVRTA